MTRYVLPLLAAVSLSALTGCYVSKHGEGKNESVDVGTPFGSVHVKTDDAKVAKNLGLTVYPGASVVHEDGKDKQAANVNLDFGDFHLGVVAAAYQTTDVPSKVEAFYRKDLSKYGAVIKCQGDTTIGAPVRTEQGLTCKDNDEKNSGHVHVIETGDGKIELRAGSPQHQHIAGIEAKSGGTKIGLVALDLPGSVSFHDGDKDRNEQ
ncbi:MAG: hypothetical protein PW792_02460 [Acidobacteriaceae bacterium]|nr:hypothetical protein [Acidobacteriaceae bacterium]